MALKYLLRKEFLQIQRNAFVPRLIVMFPIMMMCVMPWVMNMEVKNIVVDVVDNDCSTMSMQLVHRMEASRYFVFGGQKTSYQEAMDDVESSKADIIVEIPQHFERDVMRGERPEILIAANAVNGTKGTMGNAYMSSIINWQMSDFASTSKRQKYDVDNASDMVSALYLYNKHLSYKLFMIPSLMAILIMLMCGFLPALNIVGEKESGTIEAVNVTPVGKWEFILAKLIPYWLIVWHHFGRKHGAGLSPGIAFGIHLQWLWIGDFQLQRHYATGCVRDVVLCDVPLASERIVHSRAFDASLGLSHHLCQSDALFHRCHPYRLRARRRLRLHRPSGVGIGPHGNADECLGCDELSQEFLIMYVIQIILSLQPWPHGCA